MTMMVGVQPKAEHRWLRVYRNLRGVIRIPTTMKLRFDNTYAALPERFYSRLDPVPVSSPETIRVNEALAERLGFDPEWLASKAGAEFAVGNRVLQGAEPIAMVYGGHQFGNWAGRLGDGRALLLGEVLDESDERFDVQLKGSGRTPYSRGGDGRSPLGPVLREYIVSEAMAALGIPTTRALVAATTGEAVQRQTVLPGGVLVRVAKSHVRVGTFEYFSSQSDADAIRVLAEHVISRHYPQIEGGSLMDLLRAVAERQAHLVAQWQLVGFIHGVMNTDNTLLSGETIDYGPCAFMNEYDPATVFSSIDRRGRYAYGNQPQIAQWNLSRLAQALVGAAEDRSREAPAEEDTEEDADGPEDAVLAEAQEVVDSFPELFRDAYSRGMARKLGLSGFDDADWPLVEDLLELMYETSSDYTLTFAKLTELVGLDPARSNPASSEATDSPLIEEFGPLPDAFEPWIERWRSRAADDSSSSAERQEVMRANNPVFIPRNHRVEAALVAAVNEQDFSKFHELVDVLAHPYQYESDRYEAGQLDYARPPTPEQRVEATFCGT
jgi:uncharacterized protein YdiU (UPF0061 family)